jgi:hypothetical protein
MSFGSAKNFPKILLNQQLNLLKNYPSEQDINQYKYSEDGEAGTLSKQHTVLG